MVEEGGNERIGCCCKRGGCKKGFSATNKSIHRVQHEPEQLIQTKSLVEQITPLVQRQVEEEKALQRSLKELEPQHLIQPDRMPPRLTQMRPVVRFHS